MNGNGNYPPGVWHNMPGAPWNEPETETCAVCAREFFIGDVPRGVCPDDVDAHAPETEHGETHTLCRSCEDENSLCVNACGFYLEPFHGTTYNATDARRCPVCAIEHGPEFTQFTRTLEPWKKRERCAVCGTGTRVALAFTDGRTVPRAVTEFTPVCKVCRAKHTAATLSILVHAYTGRGASVACEHCDGAGVVPATDAVLGDHETACGNCTGTGNGDGRAVCGACHGTGRVNRDGAAVTCAACNGDGLTVARCTVCDTHAAADDIGTTCRSCGRGVITGI